MHVEPTRSTYSRILVITAGGGADTQRTRFLDREVEIETVCCGDDTGELRALIAARAGDVDAIALDGWPLHLQLGNAAAPHACRDEWTAAASGVPLVDGSGIRAALERWGVRLADRAEPGMLARKRVLMCPGLNHPALAQALSGLGGAMHYADPVLFFDLPDFPGVGARMTLDQSAPAILRALRAAPPGRLQPQRESRRRHGHQRMFRRAQIIAGDAATILRFAPDNLARKTVVVDSIDEQQKARLRQRGAAIVITLMPSLDGDQVLARHGAAVVEAVFAALRRGANLPLTEDTYLDMIADLEWHPGIEYLQPGDVDVNRFAFVLHPLSVRMINSHPRFRWTRHLPDALVEWAGGFLPPMFVSRVTGARSPLTGQRVEGYLYTLGATPRQMMQRGVRSTYRKLNRIARSAERRGARIMGLGAFTSVIGDAGKTVAKESDIAVTSGNSLTVAATLEAAKQAVISMGAQDLTTGRAMIVGATGSIGAVCARLIAQAIGDVVLISIEPERLIELKRRIQQETPGCRVVIGTRTDEHLPRCDLVITATSAFGQRVVNLARCKPGAVVCDVARPHDISAAEAAVRPDVLVIDSGEVLIPGDIDFGYDIGLPPGVAYACLAETCLLAMAGRYEDYTIGRDIDMARVKGIYKLFREHEFRIAGLHSFDEDVTEQTLATKRSLAQQLRDDPARLTRTMREAQEAIEKIPVAAKGVRAGRRRLHAPWIDALIDFADRRFSQR